MNSIIQNFEKFQDSVDEYLKNLENYIEGSLGEPVSLLDYLIKDEISTKFYYIIYHIILDFLLNNKKSKELFIQIPAKELGKTDIEAENNFQKLKRITGDAILVATRSQLLENTTLKSLTESFEAAAEGDYWFLNKEVCPRDTVSEKALMRKRLWVKEKKQVYVNEKDVFEDRLILSESCHDKKTFGQSKRDEILTSNLDKVLKIKSLTNKLQGKQKNANRDKIIKQLTKDYEIIEKLRNLNLKDEANQYKNGIIFGYKGEWNKDENETLINSQYIDTTVEYTVDYNNRIQDYDIMAFLGDNTYEPYENRIRNSISNGNVKKVIYIGTNIYDNFQDRNTHPLIFPFSSKEIYRYFSKEPYPNIIIEKIDYLQLIDRLASFEEKLRLSEKLEEEEINNILGYVSYLHMSGKKIDMEENERRLLNWLENHTSIIDNYTDVIVDEYKNGFKDIQNPKIGRIQELKSQLNDYNLVLLNRYNYSSEISRALRAMPRYRKFYWIIDMEGDWTDYSSILKYITFRGINGTFHFLTYKTPKRLIGEIRDSLKSLTTPYRQLLFPEISLENIQKLINTREGILTSSIIENENDSLIFEDLNFYEDSRSVNRNYGYSLANESQQENNLKGDVIINNEIISLATLYQEKDSLLPAHILFYRKPEKFKYYISIAADIDEKEIKYCASLWREVLEKYCKEKYDSNFDLMERLDFPFINNLERYYRNRVRSLFPLKIRLIVKKLVELRLISNEEAKRILKANKNNRRNTIYGLRLKDAVYQYKVSGEMSRLLRDIEEKAGERGRSVSAENICNESLVGILAKEIERIESEVDSEPIE